MNNTLKKLTLENRASSFVSLLLKVFFEFAKIK